MTVPSLCWSQSRPSLPAAADARLVQSGRQGRHPIDVPGIAARAARVEVDARDDIMELPEPGLVVRPGRLHAGRVARGAHVHGLPLPLGALAHDATGEPARRGGLLYAGLP